MSLVCPDCSEGPDRCECDNAVDISSSKRAKCIHCKEELRIDQPFFLGKDGVGHVNCENPGEQNEED